MHVHASPLNRKQSRESCRRVGQQGSRDIRKTVTIRGNRNNSFDLKFNLWSQCSNQQRLSKSSDDLFAKVDLNSTDDVGPAGIPEMKRETNVPRDIADV